MKRPSQSTRFMLTLERLEVWPCMSGTTIDTTLAKPSADAQTQIGQAYGQFLFSFEASQ